jgi:hypothetical protein
MGEDTPPFEVECPECGFSRRTDDFAAADEFVEKHRTHTGHDAEWVRADFEAVLPETEWRVRCRSCGETWHFDSRADAQSFKADHTEFTDHQIPGAVESLTADWPSGGDGPDKRSLLELIEALEPRYDGGVPERIILARYKPDDIAIDEAREEIEQLVHRGEVFELRTGRYRTT